MIKEWLDDELAGSKFWLYILFFAFLSFAMSRLYILFLLTIKITIIPKEYYPGFLRWSFSNLPAFVCQWLREETLFRLLPIISAFYLAIVLKCKLVCFAVVIVISSVGFGFYHSHNIIVVILQTVIGLLWSLLFLKAGGWRGRYFKAFLSSFSVHALYNFFIVVVANFSSHEWLRYYR